MASLAPATYINDDVVHFAIRYLLTAPTPFGDDPGLHRARWEDIVAMDSLWFTEIQKRWQATPREAAWFSTSFTENIDVFQRSYLIVPINDASHWNLILA
ncbi:hypothetical protein CF319_g8824 [Tilletia indica]|nr:hypothetical protein CF319_g8824 [Tilletia indica]